MSHLRSIDLIERYFKEKGYDVSTIGDERKGILKITSPTGKTLSLDKEDMMYPFPVSALRNVFGQKKRTYELMSGSGIPIPGTLIVNKAMLESGSFGQELLEKYDALVVKPQDGRRSRGLTIDITSEEALREAIVKAMETVESGDEVIVQEQFYGEEARFYVINGKVRGVLHRKKPSVVGDGTHTLAELITAENEVRATITSGMQNPLPLNETIIEKRLLESTDVPAAGEEILLSDVVTMHHGASIYNITDSVHPSFFEAVEAVAKDFGKGMFVADFMSKDYTKPAEVGNYTFIECNLNAFLPMCYSSRDGKQFRIVEEYLGPMLEEAIEQQSV